MGLVINFVLTEQTGLFDEVLEQRISTILVGEPFLVFDYIDKDEELYWILSLDTEELLPSMHSLPFFNSFMVLDDEIYAANNDGIFKLSGDTDNGTEIHTGIIWDKTSFGIPNNKRFRVAFVDGDIDDVIMELTTTSGSGVSSAARNRLPVGRNLYGRDWEVRLADFGRLESFEMIPTILRK